MYVRLCVCVCVCVCMCVCVYMCVCACVELKDQFNMTVDNDMLTLPDIYWTPKLHKTPVKPRFIIASKHCTIKHLSKDISSIFSLFNKQIETYNKKAHYYSGIKSY